MKRRVLFWLLVLGGAFAVPANAQSAKDAEIQELRQRLLQLEKQVGAREKGGEPRSKTTEIGARIRPLEPQLVVRVYDVGDLFVLAPRYEARRQSDLGDFGSVFPQPRGDSAITATLGGMWGGIGGMRNVPVEPVAVPARSLTQATAYGYPDDTRPSLESLIQSVVQTITPNDWDSVGGPQTIKQLGNLLIVSASGEAHSQISELLGLLRQRWGTLRIMNVQSHWLWLSRDEVESLLAPEADGNGRAYGAIAPRGSVNRKAWQELLRNRAGEDDEALRGFQAAVTCYNGQTVHIIAGTHRLAVTDLEPVVASGVAANNVQTSVLMDGIALQVTPTASATGKYVVLDLHSRVTKLGEEKPIDAERRSPHALCPPGESIDRPTVAEQRLSTTVRIPVDRPMLVGGMTFGAQGNAKQPLYLFVEASIQELKDEPQPDQSTDPPVIPENQQ